MHLYYTNEPPCTMFNYTSPYTFGILKTMLWGGFLQFVWMKTFLKPIKCVTYYFVNNMVEILVFMKT